MKVFADKKIYCTWWHHCLRLKVPLGTHECCCLAKEAILNFESSESKGNLGNPCWDSCNLEVEPTES